MIPGNLARRYARALFGLAQTPSQREKFLADLEALAEALAVRDELGGALIKVVAANRYPLSQRKSALASLARHLGVDPTVQRFVDYVLERDRIAGISDIARAFRRFVDASADRVRAELVSAHPLSPDAVSRLTAALERATGKRVIAEASVDADLIGGVVAKVGSYVLDGSVRSHLANLRASLRQL